MNIDAPSSEKDDTNLEDNVGQQDTEPIQIRATILVLPPELRLMIYKFLFYDTYIKPKGMNLIGEDMLALRTFPLGNLLLVNRLISNESLPVFWQLVTLDITRTPAQISTRIHPGPAWQRSCSLKNLLMRSTDFGPEAGSSHIKEIYIHPHKLNAELMRRSLKILTLLKSFNPVRYRGRRGPRIPFEEIAREKVEEVLDASKALRWVPELRLEIMIGGANPERGLADKFVSIAGEVLEAHGLAEYATLNGVRDDKLIVYKIRKSNLGEPASCSTT